MVTKKKTSKAFTPQPVGKGKEAKPVTVKMVGKTFVAKTRIRRLPKPALAQPVQE
jgi:hypothetical protein